MMQLSTVDREVEFPFELEFPQEKIFETLTRLVWNGATYNAQRDNVVRPELKQWLADENIQVAYTSCETIAFKTENDRLLFKLRWA